MLVPCVSCKALFRLDSSRIKPTGSRLRCSNCKTIFKAYPPAYFLGRRHQRFKTRNLIYHVSYDKTGRLISQGLGKALDISKGGMLLETTEPLEAVLLSLMATDVRNNLTEIDGNLVYCKKKSTGRYHSGVSFLASENEITAFATKLIKEFNFRKRNLLSEEKKNDRNLT